jgi:flagellar biosynthesis protein FlhF
MQIKTFKAASMKDVLSQIKDDLGSDAVIISKREVMDETFGKKTRPMIEVTAAIDYDAKKFDYHLKGMLSSNTSSQPRVIPDIATTHDQNPLSDEIFELKEMMKELIAHTGLKLHEKNPLRSELIKKGIRAHLIDLILSKLGDGAQIKSIKDLLKKVIRTKEAVDEKVWVFLGTTGVGKTTTMAKIAARSVLSEGKSAGMITLDTYRIGAIDQGRIYAKILNIPFISVKTVSEFSNALAQLDSMDVILVDTIGRSPFCGDYIPQLSQYFDAVAACKFLLMPVATRDSEMDKVTKTFSRLGINRMIFTKEDEAIHTGSIISHNLQYRIPVSHITNGQRVPEDIKGASSSKIVERCLGDIS